MRAPRPEDPRYATWQECFEAYEIPQHLHEGLERYIVGHVQPGGFLCSVLDNNLQAAVMRADERSLQALRSLLHMLYNEVPAPCLNRKEWER